VVTIAGMTNCSVSRATVHLSHDRGFAIDYFDLAGKGRLWQPGQCGEHLSGLVAVVVDGLLAQDYQ
jgi:hypothetical protein